MAELRYSDKDLKEFEALIHDKLASARKIWTNSSVRCLTATTTARRTPRRPSK